MNVRLLMVITGIAALISGVSFSLPLFLSFHESPYQIKAFLIPMMLSFACGMVLIRCGRGYKERLLVKDSVLIMLLLWGFFIVLGMMPYVISGHLGVFDALCESVSGFTTTGFTLFNGTESRALVFWRSMTQWIGGLSIIMILVTLMPQMNSSISLNLVLPHMSFVHPLRSMKKMAYGVAFIYITLTILAIFACLLAGLPLFDAINITFVTLGTGGCYSLSNPAVQKTPFLEIILIIFMFVSSGNFLLYWQAVRKHTLKDIFENREQRVFITIFFAVAVFVSMHLFFQGIYSFGTSLRHGFFETASFLSTTGFHSANFFSWPEVDKRILVLLVLMGGCIGSSAGGFKVLRVMILAKAAVKDMKRMLHPHMVMNISIGSYSVPNNVVGWVLIFFLLYVVIFFIFSALISLDGIGEFECMSLVVACFSNVGTASIGAGSGIVFAELSVWVKSLCCILMLIGRVEIFSILVVLELIFGRSKSRW